MSDKAVGELWMWVTRTAERVENPDIFLRQHIQDVKLLIRKLVEERAKMKAHCDGVLIEQALRDFGIDPETY